MNYRLPALTVRLKLVNLDHVQQAPKPVVSRSSESYIPALVGSGTDRTNIPKLLSTKSGSHTGAKADEVCLKSGNLVRHDDFEDHIECCEICSNRVELQLDFIETLEGLLCQRKESITREGLRGALLVSTPELKFAICGELEV